VYYLAQIHRINPGTAAYTTIGVVPVSEGTVSDAVITIPVRDEAKRIGSCLAALACQSTPARHVVLLLNNCTDDTAEVIRKLPPGPHQLHIVERRLEAHSASAGVARSLAMDYAASLLKDEDEGVLLSTDADAEVPENWVEANLRAIEEGADAVCGQAVIDPIEALLIPTHLHEDDAREVAYGRLLDEIESIVLPDPADPWPRHREDSGASIAITASMFRAAGGMPPLASGEDRALIARLRSIDARVRHHPQIRVVVSGRIEGRAPGGMADTIRRRMVQQDEFVDECIEPAWRAFRRLRMKRRFTVLWRHPTRPRLQRFATLMAMDPNGVEDALASPYLGQGWSQIERATPLLSPRRVRFAELTRETQIAMEIRRSLMNRVRYSDELTAA
jgi:glycosyltransferase involved in cell wall biosynthesis